MIPPRRTPYVPPRFEPSLDAMAPIQLPAAASAAQLANELHAQLSRLASGRDLRHLRKQARDDFRAVMRHARSRRLDGNTSAPFDLRVHSHADTPPRTPGRTP